MEAEIWLDNMRRGMWFGSQQPCVWRSVAWGHKERLWSRLFGCQIDLLLWLVDGFLRETLTNYCFFVHRQVPEISSPKNCVRFSMTFLKRRIGILYNTKRFTKCCTETLHFVVDIIVFIVCSITPYILLYLLLNCWCRNIKRNTPFRVWYIVRFWTCK